jgi:Na+/melibiose symporter-like transporter
VTDTERALVEETLLEPTAPHGGALPLRLFANRPFLWLAISTGFGNVSFWGYLGVLWAQAGFHLHASAAQMSILLGAFTLPIVLLVPLEGMLVDRWSAKWTNVLGTATWIGAIPIAWGAHSLGALYVSGLVAGVGVASLQPTRSALIGLMVDEPHLLQANGQLSVAIQAGLIAGPLAGAFLLRAEGPDVIYASAIVVGVVALAFSLAIPDLRHGRERPALSLRELGRGFRTSWRVPDLRMLLALYGVGWLVINVIWSLEPLFLKNTLHVQGDAIQFLWAAHGAGAVVGALAMSRASRSTGRELPLIGTGVAGTGATIVVYIAGGNYPLGLAMAFVGGIGFSVFLIASIALIQRMAGHEELGRVTSVFAILQEGTGLVASAVIVSLGSVVVVRPALLLSGIVMGMVGILGLGALSRLEARRVAVAEMVDG